MTKEIVIISAGNFGREISSIVSDAIAAGKDWRIKGFLDSRKEILNGFNREIPILSSVEAYEPRETDLFLCAIGSPADRKQYSEIILNKGGRFATLVHPTAVIGANVTLGEGVMIAQLAVLTADMVLEDSVYAGPHSCLSHDTRIGKWSQISGHCAFGGGVTVEEGCFFGVGAILMPGAYVGKNAFVGIGSVVLKKVKPDTKVFGNPAVVV
jgi:sugar O-acyltransferase (sialic acid O-acetyltransferase NeuD family)